MTYDELLNNSSTQFNDWYAQQKGYTPVRNEDGRFEGYSYGEDGEGMWRPEDDGESQYAYRNSLLGQFKTANPNTVPLGQAFGFADDSDYSYWGVGSLEEMMKKYQGDGTFGTDPTTGMRYFKPNSGVVNPFPDYNPKDNEFGKWLGLMALGMGGGALLSGAGFLGGAAAGAGEGALYGGLDGLMGDSLANYAAGMGSNNILTGVAGLEGAASGLESIDVSGYTPDPVDYYPDTSTNMSGTEGSYDSPLSSEVNDAFSEMNNAPESTEMPTEPSLDSSPPSDRNADGTRVSDNPELTSSDPVTEWLRTLKPNDYINGLTTAIRAGAGVLATNAQKEAARRAQETLMQIYRENVARSQPWIDAGVGGLNRLIDLTTPGKQFTAMQADPGYQFRLEEGTNALNNRLKAGGKFYSGSALKGGQEYAQNFASNEFGNVFNRNASLAGLGQTATTNVNSNNTSTGNNIASMEKNMGDLRASGYGNIAGSISGGLNAYGNSRNYDALMGLASELLRSRV